MNQNSVLFREVVLPWSEGCLSAKLWQVGEKSVVGVPELGLHCYGASQSQAVFRLFTTLVRYYRQLKANQSKLNTRGQEHLRFLTIWIRSIEKRMIDGPIASVGTHRAHNK